MVGGGVQGMKDHCMDEAVLVEIEEERVEKVVEEAVVVEAVIVHDGK